MVETRILRPLSEDEIDNNYMPSSKKQIIKDAIENLNKNINLTVMEWLENIKMTMDEYIYYLRSKISPPTIYLQRNPKTSRLIIST